MFWATRMIVLFGDAISVDISVAHVTKLHLVDVLDELELNSNARTSMSITNQQAF